MPSHVAQYETPRPRYVSSPTKPAKSRRGTHASDNTRGQRIARIMMHRKQRRIRIVIDTRHHAPCNLRSQALCMLLKTLAKLGTAQERNARIVLDLIGCGDLSSRHALFDHSRREIGTRRINGCGIARGAAADNSNIDRLMSSHEETSCRKIGVLCAHTQIYANVTLMHYNDSL